MKTIIYVNPRFFYLTEFVEKIPENFNTLGSEIYNGRNEVRRVTIQGLPVAIKYFRKITIVNRLIYASVRKSKAQRSFEHSEYIKKRGITTPEPIAWIDTYKNGILFKSFYVSQYSNYRPFEELLKQPTIESEYALKSFARFVFKLHTIGILHDDFTVRNILYEIIDDEYDFSLIDANRMRFRGCSRRRGAENLERLKIPIDKMGIIAAEYAYQADISDLKMLNAMTLYRIRYLMRLSIKKWFKSLLNVFSKKKSSSRILKQVNKEQVEVSMNS